MPRLRLVSAALCALFLLNACAGYRVVRPDEVEWPSYEPREVPVPERCETLIRRAAVEGMDALSQTEAREVQFCQQQQIVRAQEEEAAAARLEAHAAAASFALRVAVVVAGAVVGVLAWAL